MNTNVNTIIIFGVIINISFGKVIKVVWGTTFWNFDSHKIESSQTLLSFFIVIFSYDFFNMPFHMK